MCKKLSLMFFGVFLFLFSSHGFTGNQHRVKEKKPWWSNTEVLDTLSVTNQQRSSIEKTASEHEKTIMSLRAKHRLEQGEFRDKISNPYSTNQEILSIHDQLLQTKAELRKAKIEMMFSMSELLSFGQRKKLSGMKITNGVCWR